jgi:hypothetical protein
MTIAAGSRLGVVGIVDPPGVLCPPPADSGILRELHLVTNWFSELERLAPPAGGKP